MRMLPRFYRDIPLSGKFNLIIILSVFLSLGLLIGIYVDMSRDVTIRNAIDAGIRNLDLIGDNIEGVFRHAEAFSRIIVTNKDLQKISSESTPPTGASRFTEEYLVRIILDGIIQQRDVVSSVVIRFLDGRLFGSGHVDMKRLVLLPNDIENIPENFYSEWQKPVIVPTRPVHYEVNENVVRNMAVVRQFISIDRASVHGTITMNIREEVISAHFSDGADGANSSTYLVDNNGEVLVSSNPDYSEGSIKDTPYYRFLADGAGGRIVEIDKRRYLVTYKPVGNQGWRLVRLSVLSSLLLPGRRIIFLIIGIGVVCLALASVLSILLSRTITKPVRDLTEAMDLAGQGDLETRVEETGNDEIGKMTRYFNRMVEQISDLMSEVYQEQSDRRRFELMALQTQIRPHFLYNALDGVCALVQMNRSDDAFRMGKALSLFYRGALSGGRNIISLEEELDIVRQYLTIQSFRYSGDFSYDIDVDDRFLQRRALKLSLQPLVENAMYHGIRGMSEKGYISIRAEDQGPNYSIVVQDNGAGFPVGYKGGFGIQSVRERVKLYFGSEGIVEIESVPGDTRVRIVLPVLRGNDG